MHAALFVLAALIMLLVCCFVDRWFYERRHRKWEREVQRHALTDMLDRCDHDPGAD